MNSTPVEIIQKGIIFHRIDENTEKDSYYQDQSKGYSVSIRRDNAKHFKKGMLAIVEINKYPEKEYIIHMIENKSKATSNEKKISLSKSFNKINIDISESIKKLNQKQINLFNKKYNQQKLFILSKKLSLALFKILLEQDPEISNYISNIYFKPFESRIIEEVKKNIFNFADFHNAIDEKEITFEDNAILKDIHNLLPKHNIDNFGCYSYQSYDAELFIFIANRNKIEDYFGVDLVYLNDIEKNIIMIQYKMLKEEKHSWVCRDRKLEKQIKKMQTALKKYTEESESDESKTVYRMNSNPFFIRFLKNNQRDNGFNSYIIPLELYEILNEQGKFKGENDGFCIKDSILTGKSLGISDLSNLVKNGYIGTYPTYYKDLSQIISLLSKRIEEHPLILGLKKAIDTNEYEDFL